MPYHCKIHTYSSVTFQKRTQELDKRLGIRDVEKILRIKRNLYMPDWLYDTLNQEFSSKLALLENQIGR